MAQLIEANSQEWGSGGPAGATRLPGAMLMLQSAVLQMACNSPKGPTSLHVLSLGGARLQSGACKLVGTGAQNPLCYHPLGLFLGSWIPGRASQPASPAAGTCQNVVLGLIRTLMAPNLDPRASPGSFFRAGSPGKSQIQPWC